MTGSSNKLKALAYGRFEVKSIPDWRVSLDIMYGLELKPGQRRGEFEVVIDDAGSRLLFAEGPADDLVANGDIHRYGGWHERPLPDLLWPGGQPSRSFARRCADRSRRCSRGLGRRLGRYGTER